MLQQNLADRAGLSAACRSRRCRRLRDRVQAHAGDGRFELYKMSLKFDNPEARLAHDFPLDMQSGGGEGDDAGDREHRASVPASNG